MFAGNDLMISSGADVSSVDAQLAHSPTRTTAQTKSTEEWQATQWARWPREEDWPVTLDVYEAAALLRVSHDLIRSLLVTDRLGRAKLRHTRLGVTIRIKKADLLAYGVVPDAKNTPIL